MAIAPFLPGIFFFWSPSIIATPALSADSCPALHGSVRGRVIAFFARGEGMSDSTAYAASLSD